MSAVDLLVVSVWGFVSAKPISDWLGLTSGLCFALPPVVDQYRRRKEGRIKHGVDPNSPIGELAIGFAENKKLRRDSYSPNDMRIFILGAWLLVFSFILSPP